MKKINSLNELKEFQNEAIQMQKERAASGEIRIIISMGSTGVATGAHKTMETIKRLVTEHDLTHVTISETGGFGKDAKEPIVRVKMGENKTITYGKVTPEIANAIIQKHVIGGEPILDHIIDYT